MSPPNRWIPLDEKYWDVFLTTSTKHKSDNRTIENNEVEIVGRGEWI
jgi:hypothetical protein